MTVATEASPMTRAAQEGTTWSILVMLSMAHMLNDTMQSVIAASYPILKESFALDYGQIGLVTLCFQLTASVLQKLVGIFTDRHPMPFSLAIGMSSTLIGLILMAVAPSFAVLLVAVGLIGTGSAVFHPESSRMARLASGGRHGFAQSLFQVGGNAGSAIGPLAAAFVVMQRGQLSIEWFAGVALVGMALLWGVGRWYVAVGAARALARKSRARTVQALPTATVRIGMVLLIVLMVSKFVYSVSLSSYYTFYLIERYGLSVNQSQLCLFIFLASVALGTIIGGPIGDWIGRRRVILWSILGILPLTLVVPWLPLVPSVIAVSLAGMILASAFPAMVVYAQDLLPQSTGMVAGLLFGLAFGIAALGAAGLGVLADHWGIVSVYRICSVLPVLGLAAFLLPDLRD